MKITGLIVPLLLVGLDCHAEKLPPSLSREPNCVNNTVCLKKDQVYIDNSTLPEGFSRDPLCNADIKVICVSKFLYLEAKELVSIKSAAEAELRGTPPAKMRIDAVMTSIVLVSVYKQDYFGVFLLMEWQPEKGWVVLRKQEDIY